MKTKELMIGDWVKNCFGKNERVEQILESSVMLAYNDTYSFGEIEPIQLTKEIIKKNGLEEYVYASLNDFYYDQKYIFSIYINHLNIKIHYVHELQHALRLCKIDKEIEL